jgi:hypothetical protein
MGEVNVQKKANRLSHVHGIATRRVKLSAVAQSYHILHAVMSCWERYSCWLWHCQVCLKPQPTLTNCERPVTYCRSQTRWWVKCDKRYTFKITGLLDLPCKLIHYALVEGSYNLATCPVSLQFTPHLKHLRHNNSVSLACLCTIWDLGYWLSASKKLTSLGFGSCRLVLKSPLREKICQIKHCGKNTV